MRRSAHLRRVAARTSNRQGHTNPHKLLCIRCPACHQGEGQPVREHRAEDAAEHFVPRGRAPDRHRQLVEHLRQLWAGETVTIERCPSCGFGYSVPFVGGDARFYELAHDADPHYPSDRWEFTQTLQALGRPDRLVEVGAGDGAFLDRLNGVERIVAADFDRGAVERLRAKGYEAVQGSLADIRGTFDVACMFQTLEHMADLDSVFGHLHAIVAPGGSVFLSVPHGDATDFQERATGLWDMPPNHVGRWTPRALERVADRYGFELVETREEPIRTRAITAQLAVSAVNARAYLPGTLASRVNAIDSRPVRGLAKRLLAAGHVPRLLSRRAEYRPWTCWAHLRR